MPKDLALIYKSSKVHVPGSKHQDCGKCYKVGLELRGGNLNFCVECEAEWCHMCKRITYKGTAAWGGSCGWSSQMCEAMHWARFAYDLTDNVRKARDACTFWTLASTHAYAYPIIGLIISLCKSVYYCWQVMKMMYGECGWWCACLLFPLLILVHFGIQTGHFCIVLIGIYIPCLLYAYCAPCAYSSPDTHH